MGFVVLYLRDINHMNISFAERDINNLFVNAQHLWCDR